MFGLVRRCDSPSLSRPPCAHSPFLPTPRHPTRLPRRCRNLALALSHSARHHNAPDDLLARSFLSWLTHAPPKPSPSPHSRTSMTRKRCEFAFWAKDPGWQGGSMPTPCQSPTQSRHSHSSRHTPRRNFTYARGELHQRARLRSRRWFMGRAGDLEQSRAFRSGPARATRAGRGPRTSRRCRWRCGQSWALSASPAMSDVSPRHVSQGLPRVKLDEPGERCSSRSTAIRVSARCGEHVT